MSKRGKNTQLNSQLKEDVDKQSKNIEGQPVEEKPLTQSEKVEKALSSMNSAHSKQRLEYLLKLKNDSKIEPKLQERLDKDITEIEAENKHKLQSLHEYSLKLYEKDTDFSKSPEFAILKKEEKFKESLRQSKIKEINKMKKELESKLLYLDKSSEYISYSPLKPDQDHEKEEKKKEKELMAQKQKEANEFAHKMMIEQKERYKKEREQQKKIEMEYMKELDELNQKRKQEDQERLNKERNDKLKEFEDQKRQREEDRKKLIEHEKKALRLIQPKYYYQKAEEQFQREVLMPALEEKKKKLADKRNNTKSLTRDELDDHIRNYELAIESKEEERYKEQRERKKQQQRLNDLLDKYQTHTLERVTELEKKNKIQRKQKEEERKRIREKMASYSNLVKETCPVEVNKKKVEELKEHIKQLKHPVRQHRDIRTEYVPSAVNRTLKLKGLLCNSVDNLHNRDLNSREIDIQSETASKNLPPKSTKVKSSIKSVTAHDDKPKLDYLADLRKKRAENYLISKAPKFDWQQDLKSNELKPTEKYDMMMGKARLIEDQARMKEQLLQAKGGTDKNPEMGEYVSDMYVDAIKAKLAILENL